MKYSNKNSIVCPLPTLLFWRLTSGLYYEICRESGFSEAFGKSFQEYIGDVIKKSTNNKNISVYPEMEYGPKNNRKASIDWIVDDNEAIIFIECKTKRMTLKSKIELVTTEELDNELSKMADFIIQVYKTINDYINNKYPHYKYQKNKKLYPLIVTLEDWFLIGHKQDEVINTKVVNKFNKLKLPLIWIEEIT